MHYGLLENDWRNGKLPVAYVTLIVIFSSSMRYSYNGWPKVCHKNGGSAQNFWQKSSTKYKGKHTFSIQKRTKVTRNVQYFVEKYFPLLPNVVGVECMHTNLEYIQ